MRYVALVAVVFLTAAGILYWRTRPRLSDEQQIVQLILQARRAVETKNAGQLLSCVSDDYNDGTFTKRDLTRMVVAAFRSPEPYRVQVEVPTIRIQGGQAMVDVRVKLWAGQPGLPEEREIPLQVHAELVCTRGGWKVIRGRGWEPAETAVDQ